jgi:hypothetical protein
MEITVVKVRPEEVWPCDLCGEHDCVAYIHVEGVEETSGYCAGCLPGAVMAELEGAR